MMDSDHKLYTRNIIHYEKTSMKREYHEPVYDMNKFLTLVLLIWSCYSWIHRTVWQLYSFNLITKYNISSSCCFVFCCSEILLFRHQRTVDISQNDLSTPDSLGLHQSQQSPRSPLGTHSKSCFCEGCPTHSDPSQVWKCKFCIC